jgi:uncharacterized Zn-finger protein
VPEEGALLSVGEDSLERVVKKVKEMEGSTSLKRKCDEITAGPSQKQVETAHVLISKQRLEEQGEEEDMEELMDTEEQENKNPSSFLCKICKKKISFKKNLKQHIHSVHDKKNDVRCPLCGNFFAKRNMKRHTASCQKKPKTKRLDCLSCDITFSNFSHLQRHNIKIHQIKK